jgi:serine-type D-Ala-D-Ala carboxypeptidase/endopeptidase (penicillin-binding protein 4)
MQNANVARFEPRGGRRGAFHLVMSSRALFAFCILQFAFGGCAKKPPVTPLPAPPAAVVDPVQQLRADIDTLLDQPGHQHGIWGVVVESLGRTERLFERNPRTLLVPASTMKLVSAAVASETVGWEYTFETRLLATGAIANGVLDGDLVIAGGGDPSILGRPPHDTLAPWLNALRARGVTRVTGRVIGDDDDGEEPRPGFAWSWEDMGYTYGALPGALNLAENAVEITVSPGNREDLPTVMDVPPAARGLGIVNRSTTGPAGSAEELWPEWRPGDSALAINGTIPAGSRPSVVPVAAGNPTLWAATALRNALLDAGIDVEGPACDVDALPVKPFRGDATVLYVHHSPPLSELARPLLAESINLYAEAFLRLATGRVGARTADAALDAARLRLQGWGVPKEAVQIVDGSGLSRRDVIAPEALTAILRRFADASNQSPWMRAMPVAGRDGTLASRMKGTPAEGNARAKSGSMSNIRSLAGYVTTADGEPLVFAIMANNFEGSAANVVATIDRIVVRLASFRRSR